MNFQNIYFSARGRLNRKGYWISSIGLIIMMIVLIAVLGIIIAPTSLSGSVLGFKLIQLVSTLVGLFMFYHIVIKRLHDRGRSEKLAFIFVGPSLVSLFLRLFDVTGKVMSTPVADTGLQALVFLPNSFGEIVSLILIGVFIWSLIELGILSGEKDDNAHGPDPSAF